MVFCPTIFSSLCWDYLPSINRSQSLEKCIVSFPPITIVQTVHTKSQKLLLSKTGQMPFQNSCSLNLILWQKSIEHLFHWTDDIFKIYILSATGSVRKSDLAFLCIGFLLSGRREREEREREPCLQGLLWVLVNICKALDDEKHKINIKYLTKSKGLASFQIVSKSSSLACQMNLN